MADVKSSSCFTKGVLVIKLQIFLKYLQVQLYQISTKNQNLIFLHRKSAQKISKETDEQTSYTYRVAKLLKNNIQKTVQS